MRDEPMKVAKRQRVFFVTRNLNFLPMRFLERTRKSMRVRQSRDDVQIEPTKVGKHQRSLFAKRNLKSSPMRFLERTRRST